MAGITSVETKLFCKAKGDTDFTEIELLMEVPELGGDPEKIDVTTLSDKVKKYIPGVKDLGDLAFKFLYDNSTANSNYRVLKGLEENNTLATFKVQYPDGTAHEFDAYVSVKMDAAAVNAALTFTATFSLQSDITVTNPS
ncbi:Phage tail tube protein, TTP [Caminicella sporogenes DSM 14501]|uniref:Phage tail tube protein, TTP n=1 Tax=Caminicella sporogenes DSM 14501 TaxID=1121266 RepID=A0A1M6MXK1_9FIRM|nr:phage tail tube protein [Caminicella sporogenes]RKD22454.1 phage tail protein [Caminicella sporogenes]SHJ88208.1 Phage tail tube protein, TTP [Caminicella sporogenes DSM 14501]